MLTRAPLAPRHAARARDGVGHSFGSPARESWAILSVALRGRRMNLRAAAVVAGVLLALGLVGTFSPIFELFNPD